MDNILIILLIAVGAYFLLKHLLGKVYSSDFIKGIRPLIVALIVLLFGLYITFVFSREPEHSISNIIEKTTIGNYIEGGDLADIYDMGKSSGAFEDSGLPIPNNLIMWAGAAEIVAFIVIAVVLVLCFIMFRRLFKKNDLGIDAMRIYYVVSGVLMVVSVFISLIASIKIAKFILGSLATKDPSPLSLMWSLSILVVLAVVFIIYNNALPRLYMPADQVMGGDNNLLVVPPATPEQVSMQNESTKNNADIPVQQDASENPLTTSANAPTQLSSLETSNTETPIQSTTSNKASTNNPSGEMSKRTMWTIIGVLGGALLIVFALYFFSSSDNNDLDTYNSTTSSYESEDESYTDESNQYPFYSDDDNDEYSSRYDNYVETSSCEDGVVVYEGRGDYYIIETGSGYTVLETYSGILNEGDRVRGELNKYSFTYIINTGNDSEIKVSIEDYMLSDKEALGWLGEHNHLKYSDQEIYDSN